MDRETDVMKNMTVPQIFDAIDSGMKEVALKLASGEIEGSGRFWTDAELAAGAATDTRLKKDPPSAASAA